MRLIDADNLKLAIDEGVKTVSKEVGLSKQLTRILLAEFAHTVLNEAPTVKAIPIEYIKAFKKKVRHIAPAKAVIEWLLENWEKENERP